MKTADIIKIISHLKQQILLLEQQVMGLESSGYATSLPFESKKTKKYTDYTQPSFSGVAYVCGVKITGLNKHPDRGWVKCVESTRTAEEVSSAPSSPFPDGVEYYEKANTYGDIHAFSH